MSKQNTTPVYLTVVLQTVPGRKRAMYVVVKPIGPDGRGPDAAKHVEAAIAEAFDREGTAAFVPAEEV